MRALLLLLRRLLLVLLCGLPLAAGAARLSAPQLEQLVSPIALYPDPLLSQILMASTFPTQVAAAAAWSQRHPELSGDEAVQAVQEQDWDPSVQSLAAVPDVLAMMGSQPDWVSSLGKAFQTQPKDVMAAVQQLRSRAEQAGYLNDTEAQTLVVGTDNSLAIEPSDDGEFYLPYYDSAVVYGIWPYPAYPPFIFLPPFGHDHHVHHHDGIRFGNGIPIHNALWGGCDWQGHRLFVNAARFNTLYPQRPLTTTASMPSWHRSLLTAAPVATPQGPSPMSQSARSANIAPAAQMPRHAATSPHPTISPEGLSRQTTQPVAPPPLTIGARYAAAPPPRLAPYPVAQAKATAPRAYAPVAVRPAAPSAWVATTPQAAAPRPTQTATPSYAPAPPHVYARAPAVYYPSWDGGARGGFSGGGGHR
jgi:hypothetical protein